MQLVAVDAVETEILQTLLRLLTQIFGTAVGLPLLRTLPGESRFGGDDEAFRIRGESFANQALADFGPVGIGGVDEVDAQLHGAA